MGDPGSIPGLGRSPEEGKGNPLQYSCLKNPMDRGAWQATVHGVAKGWTRLSDFTLVTRQGLPRWLSGKESACQCRRPGFDAWVRKNLWRRKWQPAAVCLSGKSHGERSLAGYSPWGCKRVNTTYQLNNNNDDQANTLSKQTRNVLTIFLSKYIRGCIINIIIC